MRASGHSLNSLDLAEFPASDACAGWGERVRRHLQHRGTALVSGFPVAQLGLEEASMAFWWAASAIGAPLLQNKEGARIDLVQNEERTTVRGAKSNRELPFHSDFANATPDAFGLLAVRQAKSGGESLLADGRTVAAMVEAQEPAAAAVLREEFCFDRTGDVGPDQSAVIRHPVFLGHGEGVRVLYNRARIHRGHRHEGIPLTEAQSRALEVLDGVLSSPEHAVRTRMRPGDALFIDNSRMLHSRTAFVDWPERERRRLLLRVWLRAGRTDDSVQKGT